MSGWHQEQEYQAGIRAERERIVELLEPLFDKAENAETRRLLTMGIALIKGESQKNSETIGKLHEGACCAKCAWDVNGVCCCIPERQGEKK